MDRLGDPADALGQLLFGDAQRRGDHHCAAPVAPELSLALEVGVDAPLPQGAAEGTESLMWEASVDLPWGLSTVWGTAEDRCGNRRFLAQITSRKCNEVALSAKTGKGCYDLQSAIDRRLSKNDRVVDIRVDLKDGNAIAWLYANGSVLDRKDDDSYAYFRVSLTSDNHGRFQNRTNSIETN